MNGETKSQRKEQGFYVYCIAERDSLAQVFEDALPRAIESDSALELIAQEDLAAVTSPVPLSDYGEDALQERLTDATWTAIRAMRHEKVVEHFARSILSGQGLSRCFQSDRRSCAQSLNT